jgi:hypothetical protein
VREVFNVLRLFILVDTKVFRSQAGDVSTLRIFDADIEDDQLDAVDITRRRES